MYQKLIAKLFPILLLLFIQYTHANVADFGPLVVRSQAPLQSTGVTTRIRDASNFGGFELYLSGAMASIWARSEDFTLDYYQNEVFTGVQVSLTPALKAEFSYLYRYAGNNHLDSLTIGFHDLFSISQNGRESVDNHRFYIEESKHTGEIIEGFEGEVLNNSWELYLEQLLFQNSYNALSVGATLYYNYVGSGMFKNASLEQAAQLNYTGWIGNAHSVYMMASVTRRTPEDFTTMELKEWTVNAGISYQYRPMFNYSYLLEYRIYEGEAEDLGDLSEPAHEITLGYRLHYAFTAFEFALVENMINMDNSADIAFTVSLRHKF